MSSHFAVWSAVCESFPEQDVGSVSLGAAMTKLADTEVNGGAGITFDEDYPVAAIDDLTYGWDAYQKKASESLGGVMSGYGFSSTK